MLNISLHIKCIHWLYKHVTTKKHVVGPAPHPMLVRFTNFFLSLFLGPKLMGLLYIIIIFP